MWEARPARAQAYMTCPAMCGNGAGTVRASIVTAKEVPGTVKCQPWRLTMNQRAAPFIAQCMVAFGWLEGFLLNQFQSQNRRALIPIAGETPGARIG